MLKGFEQRVVDDKDALDRKTRSLLAFMATDDMKALPHDEQLRITNQSIAMKNYSSILAGRIHHFAP